MVFWVLVLIYGSCWEVNHNFVINPTSIAVAAIVGFCVHQIDKQLGDWMPR